MQPVISAKDKARIMRKRLTVMTLERLKEQIVDGYVFNERQTKEKQLSQIDRCLEWVLEQ